MAVNFISFKDSYEIHTMRTKSDNTETMIRNETGETIK